MTILKSSFLRLFTTGFVAGAIAVAALQPAETRAFGSHLPTPSPAERTR